MVKEKEEEEEPPTPSGGYFWGPTPSEDDYYASHGVRGSRSFFTSSRGGTGLTLFARSWQPLQSPPRAVVCMVHGYGNDVSWTFQSTAIFFAGHGFHCVALDLPGHGLSHGLRAFVPDLNPVLQDLLSFFNDPSFVPSHLPRFLYGESMGGAICLLLHLRQPQLWSGAVLVAPMCKISDDIKPPWPVPQILTAISRFAPTLACVPTADLLDKSVKVPHKKVISAKNPLRRNCIASYTNGISSHMGRYAGRPRLGTVVELLRVTEELHAKLHEVTVPFLVVHGSADVVTDPGVSRELCEKASSQDKSIEIYEGMMHSLLWGEPEENVDMVRGDILTWLLQRSGSTEQVQEQEKIIVE